MNVSDLENNNNFELTILDEHRIDDLDILEGFKAECGDFILSRNKDGKYIIFLIHEGLIRKHNKNYFIFDNKEDLLRFLKQ